MIHQKQVHWNSPNYSKNTLKMMEICRWKAQQNKKIDVNELSLSQHELLDNPSAHLRGRHVWSEIKKALETKHFDLFIENLRQCGLLKRILPDLEKLWSIPEKPKYHPEGNSGDHTLLAIKASKQDDPMVTFALLLHDIGKTRTPSDRLPSHHGHEKLGLPVIEKICQQLRIPKNFHQFATLCSKNHMKFFSIPEMKPGTLYDFLKEITNNFQDQATFEKFVEVCRCDNYGRAISLSPEEIKRHNDSAQICRDAIQNVRATNLGKMPHAKELIPSPHFSEKVREYIITQMQQKTK